MERITMQAKDGYIFTQIAEVPIEQRVWGRIIDTTQLEKFHEVPIEDYEEWKEEMIKISELRWQK